jgi:kinesin family member 15
MASQENIRVSVRVRPCNRREIEAGASKCVTVDAQRRAISVANNKTFTFDYVADEISTQEEIYLNIGKPVADNCLNGYNGCIFAYGQTSSGKVRYESEQEQILDAYLYTVHD